MFVAKPKTIPNCGGQHFPFAAFRARYWQCWFPSGLITQNVLGDNQIRNNDAASCIHTHTHTYCHLKCVRIKFKICIRFAAHKHCRTANQSNYANMLGIYAKKTIGRDHVEISEGNSIYFIRHLCEAAHTKWKSPKPFGNSTCPIQLLFVCVHSLVRWVMSMCSACVCAWFSRFKDIVV